MSPVKVLIILQRTSTSNDWDPIPRIWDPPIAVTWSIKDSGELGSPGDWGIRVKGWVGQAATYSDRVKTSLTIGMEL